MKFTIFQRQRFSSAVTAWCSNSHHKIASSKLQHPLHLGFFHLSTNYSALIHCAVPVHSAALVSWQRIKWDYMLSGGVGPWLYRERHCGGKHSDSRGWATQFSDGETCYDFEPSIVIVVSGKRGLPTFFFNWRLITLQYVVVFVIQWHESAIGVHMSPIPNPLPFPPHPIPQGCPSPPVLGALFHALNLDSWSTSHMVI